MSYSDNSNESWYFGKMTRIEAERRLLQLPENEHGAFLVRDSERFSRNFSLSVRDGDRVKHYLISQLTDEEEGKSGFFIARQRPFCTLQQLVEHYSKDADGLCVKLRKPCAVHLTEKKKPQIKSDKWETDWNSLKFVRKLGQGQFGEVWEGLWNNTTPVAIKTPKPGMAKDFLTEAQIMKKLKPHPKLLPLYAICTTQAPVYCIVTELMQNGSLLEYLQEGKGNKKGRNMIKPISQLIDMAAQIAAGMAYLESARYIHRNLAAKSILVGKYSTVKIGGLSRLIKEEEAEEEEEEEYETRVDNFHFPIKWTAPEAAAAAAAKFSIKSDVWSFGILLTELVTYGDAPYPGMTDAEVLSQVDHGYRMPCSAGCPPTLYDIMLECWNKDPLKRPTFEMLQWKLENFFEGSEEYKEAFLASTE